jgi:hypothetical protein
MALYVAALFAVGWSSRQQLWLPPLSYLVAAIPALPMLGVIWTIFAYVTEEPDEYRRFLLMKVQLLAFGLTLAVCTAWNFLSAYTDLLPDRIWVFAVYCACIFPAQGWTYWRAR